MIRPASKSEADFEIRPLTAEYRSWADNLIEQQWRKRRLEIAMKRVQADVKPSTWEAFKRTVLEHTPPETVAGQLGLTVGNVYVCKSRVLKRLRDTAEEIDV